MAYEFNSGGTAITDEPLRLTQSVTLSGTALFRGRARGLAAASVKGNTSATFGVWAAAGKTGLRMEVITSGVPGSTAQVLWDLQSGRVYRTISSTVYARYFNYADLMNEGRIYQTMIPFQISASATDYIIDNCPWRIKFGEYQISIQGNRPSNATLTMQLRTATGGAGSGMTLTLGATAGRFTNGFLTIANPTAFDVTKKIVLRSTTLGNGFQNINVILREILE